MPPAPADELDVAALRDPPRIGADVRAGNRVPRRRPPDQLVHAIHLARELELMPTPRDGGKVGQRSPSQRLRADVRVHSFLILRRAVHLADWLRLCRAGGCRRRGADGAGIAARRGRCPPAARITAAGAGARQHGRSVGWKTEVMQLPPWHQSRLSHGSHPGSTTIGSRMHSPSITHPCTSASSTGAPGTRSGAR